MPNKDKSEILKQAIVDHIQHVYPQETLAYIGERLGMNISDVSRLFKKKLPISIEKVIRIEKALTQSSKKIVEIIKIIKPNEKYAIDKRKERNSNDESNLIIQTGGINNDLQNPDLIEEKERLLSEQIFSDNKFKGLFKELLNRLMVEIKLKKKFLDEEYDYTLRDKRQYLSINLLPDKKTIGGYHLMFIRHSIKKHQLKFQFIVPNEFFKKQIEDFSKQKPCLVKGKSPATFYPYEESRTKYDKTGQPSLTYNRKLTTEDIDNIVYLALKVLEVQKLSK